MNELNQPDWKKMYLMLVDCVDEALDILPRNGETEMSRYFLLKGLLSAEDIYLKTTETEWDGKSVTLEEELEALRAEYC